MRSRTILLRLIWLIRCRVGGYGCVRYIEGVASGKDPLRLGYPRDRLRGAVLRHRVRVQRPPGWLGGYLTGVTGTGLLAAVFANWLALRIYENRHLVEIGLWLNRRSAENLLLGLAGGAASAALVLAPALLVGAAHLTPTPDDQPTVGTIIFVSILLAAGSIGEELFFRGTDSRSYWRP